MFKIFNVINLEPKLVLTCKTIKINFAKPSQNQFIFITLNVRKRFASEFNSLIIKELKFHKKNRAKNNERKDEESRKFHLLDCVIIIPIWSLVGRGEGL